MDGLFLLIPMIVVGVMLLGFGVADQPNERVAGVCTALLYLDVFAAGVLLGAVFQAHLAWVP